MRLSSLIAGVSVCMAASSSALNILLSNDDGFGSGNLREVYRMLSKDHNVWIVAPATKQSGQGGRSVFTDSANLTAPAQYDLIPAGEPFLGTDPNDSHIWYYNGTPAACVFVALDFVLPRHADFKVPDLVVTGPNYGTNLGPFVWTLSGTAGASYAATERSIPAVAISASNDEVPYFEIHNKSNPATWAAEAGVKVVETLIDNTPDGGPILPLGYGVTVNIPPLDGKKHSKVKYVQTRMTGNAEVDEAVYDPETKTFSWGNLRPLSAGVNVCVNGDCSMEGETYVVGNGDISISVYTVDYTAPTGKVSTSVMKKMSDLTGY